MATTSPVTAATYVVVNKADAGAGSLRQAILDANASPGADIINFNIAGSPPYDINLDTALPDIIDPVTIDGNSQPDFTGQPLVMLVGTTAGAAASGLTLRVTTNCTIRGLIINRFRSHGVEVDRGGGHVISGNYIGTGATGAASQGNRLAGIYVSDSANNVIGGMAPGERNLVSGNQTGIHITGSAATNNVVLGNFIGTDLSGTTDVGNTNNGIFLQNTTGNLIGGSVAAARNVISGNNQSGVYLLGTNTTANRICGNFIGTAASGAGALANKTNGVFLYQAIGNVIGGSEPGEGNLISGNRERGAVLLGASFNRFEGNVIGLSLGGSAALPNLSSGIGLFSSVSNVIGGTNASARNVISGNQESGIAFSDALCAGNLVAGNFIGTTAAGTAAAANGLSGISVAQGTNNVIGGPDGARNVISGNTQSGVYLIGGKTTVAGNLIGTDATGRFPVRNGFNGIRVDCAGNTVGVDRVVGWNIISGNNGPGVMLFGVSASNNVIAGNYIGTTSEGTNGLGNVSVGIWITNAPRNQIGGIAPYAGNVIAGNSDSGILFNSTGATGNRILGNRIGTDASGSRGIPNAIGGIYIFGSPTNFIGGTAVGSGNVISGNATVGLTVFAANGTVIQGNYIGIQANGSAGLGNEWHCIELTNAIGTIIGGTARGAGNRIGFARTDGYDGVRVRDNTTNNTIRGNAFLQNGGAAANGLGIDLGVDGVTANDGNDGDIGANMLLNYPVITAASGRYRTSITGTLNSRPSSSFTVDFYGNVNAEASGYGEGERWLGSTSVTTGSGGNGTFSAVFTNFFGTGGLLTATTTDAAGNTSEFSAAAVIVAAGDTDGDGLPDDYETISGLNPGLAADAGFDGDNDGSTNRNELAAGTDPRSAGSVLLMNLVIEGAVASVSFDSVLGKIYKVEWANDVTGPWATLADSVAGTGAPLRISDVPENTNTRFYRVSVTSN